MRILYGVSGEGNGHATRSLAAIRHLIDEGHDVHIVCGGKAYAYLHGMMNDIHRISHLPLVYKDGRLCNIRSVILVQMTLLLTAIPTMARLYRLYREIRPDIIITDYETFSAHLGLLTRTPVLAADNLSVMHRTDALGEPNLRERWVRMIGRSATRSARWHIIPSFFPVQPYERTTVTSPSVRDEIRALKPRRKDHLFVYQTSDTNEEVLDALAGLDIACHIYGYGARPKRDNLIFHGFNNKEFYTHLACAKACVLGGGFTLTTEALHLRKPIFCVPLRKHPEQELNARKIGEMGYGMHSLHPTREDVETFLSNLERYTTMLKDYESDPDTFAKEVERKAQALTRSSSSDYTASS